ncbi:hypothetical protein L2E82_10713 [Cichorium intybus]|uniref:Uncharacterized protein n=1 Tax=Cichorium intybus TaxID=13427 RepID=A0ACB9GCG8_CICIN|nr:hypothetical protein L2E82_10713 [Cichorium intybus]
MDVEGRITQVNLVKHKKESSKQNKAHLAKAKSEPDINPNLIEVAERIIIKEKPKDPIPNVEWCDRFLPDNAVDLVDEAGSRVRLRHAHARELPDREMDLKT